MIEKKITIQNKLGLHARASAKLVNEAKRFGSQIKLIKNNKTINAKSIMAVMMLAAGQGTELEIHVDGDDAEEAWLGLETLINNRFGEAE